MLKLGSLQEGEKLKSCTRNAWAWHGDAWPGTDLGRVPSLGCQSTQGRLHQCKVGCTVLKAGSSHDRPCPPVPGACQAVRWEEAAQHWEPCPRAQIGSHHPSSGCLMPPQQRRGRSRNVSTPCSLALPPVPPLLPGGSLRCRRRQRSHRWQGQRAGNQPMTATPARNKVALDSHLRGLGSLLVRAGRLSGKGACA